MNLFVSLLHYSNTLYNIQNGRRRNNCTTGEPGDAVLL